jgi:hypothetical protein
MCAGQNPRGYKAVRSGRILLRMPAALKIRPLKGVSVGPATPCVGQVGRRDIAYLRKTQKLKVRWTAGAGAENSGKSGD